MEPIYHCIIFIKTVTEGYGCIVVAVLIFQHIHLFEVERGFKNVSKNQHCIQFV